MNDVKMAVIGIGAMGAVVAAALLKQNPETMLVDPRPRLKEEIMKRGITISGELGHQAPGHNMCDS